MPQHSVRVMFNKRQLKWIYARIPDLGNDWLENSCMGNPQPGNSDVGKCQPVTQHREGILHGYVITHPDRHPAQSLGICQRQLWYHWHHSQRSNSEDRSTILTLCVHLLTYCNNLCKQAAGRTKLMAPHLKGFYIFDWLHSKLRKNSKCWVNSMPWPTWLRLAAASWLAYPRQLIMRDVISPQHRHRKQRASRLSKQCPKNPSHSGGPGIDYWHRAFEVPLAQLTFRSGKCWDTATHAQDSGSQWHGSHFTLKFKII
jgi:hypothetical protein